MRQGGRSPLKLAARRGTACRATPPRVPERRGTCTCTAREDKSAGSLICIKAKLSCRRADASKEYADVQDSGRGSGQLNKILSVPPRCVGSTEVPDNRTQKTRVIGSEPKLVIRLTQFGYVQQPVIP